MANRSKASNLIAFVAALFIYSVFALYLYLPHLNVFAPNRRLLIPAAILAAAGTYLLSRRWISSAIASFFAGLVYAFGPFALGFGLYHPAASALIAALPFSLMPAAFWPHRPFRWAPLITAALALLPFVMIFSFFLTAAHYGLYPIPRNQRLQLAPFTGLITPLILEPLHFPYPGFYHVAVLPAPYFRIVFIFPNSPRRRNCILLNWHRTFILRGTGSDQPYCMGLTAHFMFFNINGAWFSRTYCRFKCRQECPCQLFSIDGCHCGGFGSCSVQLAGEHIVFPRSKLVHSGGIRSLFGDDFGYKRATNAFTPVACSFISGGC